METRRIAIAEAIMAEILNAAKIMRVITVTTTVQIASIPADGAGTGRRNNVDIY